MDCLPNNLLTVKLHACCTELSSLRLLYSYLVQQEQRIRLDKLWLEIFSGVPKGSILGPLSYDIFLCDLFLFTSKHRNTNVSYISICQIGAKSKPS